MDNKFLGSLFAKMSRFVANNKYVWLALWRNGVCKDIRQLILKNYIRRTQFADETRKLRDERIEQRWLFKENTLPFIFWGEVEKQIPLFVEECDVAPLMVGLNHRPLQLQRVKIRMHRCLDWYWMWLEPN